MFTRSLFATLAVVALAVPAFAQPNYTRAEDVIYGRKDGTALTMDVFTPKEKANGAGVIVVVSAEFKSGKELLEKMRPFTSSELLKRGYVVFMVTHGSQPRFTVPEIVEDMHRAVRFIRVNAKKYGVNPDRLGIAGGSSGGHLALMMGCDSRPGNPKSSDLVEREPSKVAAVACFFPVTDFLEFDKADLPPQWERFRTLFDVREIDPTTKKLERVTAERRTEYGRLCSPLYCAKKDAAPTLIIHGNKDELVPIKQSRDLKAVFAKCDATCELVEVEGMGHSAIEAAAHLPKLIDWFDKHLLP